MNIFKFYSLSKNHIFDGATRDRRFKFKKTDKTVVVRILSETGIVLEAAFRLLKTLLVFDNCKV